MASSLASQLANIGNLDAARLSATTAKSRPSFLFPARQAASLSNFDIHSLGYNGFLSLLSEDARLERYETPIFGEKAKGTDRALLTREENERLDRILGGLLRALANKFLVRNTGKVLEWLIRRFRINEFNVEELLGMVLPYHETPQFAQMLQIIDLKDAKFSSLTAVKTSLQPLPRHHLLTAMTKSHDLLLYISNLLKSYSSEGSLYPTLVGFWTGTLVGYVDRLSNINENQMTILLPVLVEGLKNSASNDVRMGSCILLSRMATKVDFSSETMDLLIGALLSSSGRRAAAEDIQAEGSTEAVITTLVILCESQRTMMEGMPKKALSNLLRLSDGVDTLVTLSGSHSAAKFLQPFLSSLIRSSTDGDHRSSTSLSSILSPLSCPSQITDIALPLLLDAAIKEEQPADVLLKVLNAVSQRAGEKYYAVCEEMQKGKEQEIKARVKRVMAAVSGYGLFDTTTASSRTSDMDIALSLSSSDAQARATALTSILESVSLDTNEEISPILASIVLERLADPATAVCKALYGNAGGQAVLAKLAVSPSCSEKLFSASLATVLSPETPRATILAHVEYLCGGFLDALSQDSEDPNHEKRDRLKAKVLQKAIWPKLLATKANAKTWKGVWEILKDKKDVFAVLAEVDENTSEMEKEQLVSVNDDLARRIANNIQAMPKKEEFVRFLLESGLSTSDDAGPATSRIFSCLSLSKLAQKGHTTIISKVLSTSSLDASVLSSANELLPSAGLANMIFAKPTSGKTLSRCLEELRYTALLSISSPKDAKWCWLTPDSNLSSDIRIFKNLATKAYMLAHTSGINSAASTSILTSLFTKAIHDDTLAFLTSIYSSTTQAKTLRTIALKDTATYLEANDRSADPNGMNDFQAVLPSLLVALGAREKDIRSAVFNVLEGIARAIKKAQQDQKIYGFDTYYGSSSRDLQYLDPAQVQRYVRLLLDSKAELLLDGAYLRLLHSTKLDEPGTSKKKSFSHAFLCYLVSHAVVWDDTAARTALLGTVRDIVDDGKTVLYRPFLTAATRTTGSEYVTASQDTIEQYAIAVTEAFSTMPKAGLEEDSLTAILSVLESKKTDKLAIALRKQVRERVKISLFKAVSPAQRLHVLERLVVVLLAPVPSEAAAFRQLAHSLHIDSFTFASFIDRVRLSFSSSSSSSSEDRSSTSSKKARSSGSSAFASRNSRLAELAILFETVDIQKVQVSKELLAVMLETLAGLVELQVSSQTEVAYHAGLLLSALSSAASRLAASSTPVDESIRISPVLEMIRISNNPSTSNQALSLVADLVDLVPEQVVQNIMPIFTFMGTNVLQRDDAYSSRVVDKTIESIVPALVKYRKKRALSQEQLIAELSDFLRVFADAANHVPRHRRNRLFVRFAEVLGPKDFLAPVCGLLVDKVALKLVKSQDATLLALPLALSASFSADIQLSAYHQLLNDLLSKVQSLNTEATDGSIASRQSTPTTPAESPALPISTSRRTVLASLTFLNQATSAKPLFTKVDQARATDSEDLDVTIQDLVKTATSFYTLTPQKLSEGDVSQLLANVEAFVLSTGRLLTVSAFAEVIQWSLTDEDTRVVRMAFDLLLTRLRTVKAARRGDLTEAVNTGIKRLQAFLNEPLGRFDRARTLQILRLLTSAATEQEMMAVGDILSTTLEIATSETSKNILNQAIAFVDETIPRLGARIIPNVNRIVSLALKLVSQFVGVTSDSTSKSIAASSLSAIEALFHSVPTFVSAQLQKIFQQCISDSVREVVAEDKSGKLALALSGLLSAATKRVPAKTLFSAVTQLWQGVDKKSSQAIAGVLDILSRGLRQSNAAAVSDTYKQTFSLLLSVFDIRREAVLPIDDIRALENSTISAFLQMVLKLNEGTFRPLFLRLFDWAVVDLISDAAGATARKITLFRTVDRMLNQLKSIAVPYYAFMLDQTAELLSVTSVETELLEAITSALRRALEHDTTGFWTVNRLSKLVQPIVQQVESINMLDSRFAANYTALLTTFAQTIEPQEQILHDIIRAYLQKTRSDSEAVQLAAIKSLQTMWDAGIEASMAAHSAESMPFLVETLESGGQIERATKDLLARMNEDEGGDESSEDESEDGSQDEDE